jgi:hypothetical protein
MTAETLHRDTAAGGDYGPGDTPVPGPSGDAAPTGGLFGRQRFDVGCTVEVSHKFESLHAHVELDGEVAIHPGDEVLVHGAPIHPDYGEVVRERRTATVVRATRLERLWTRLTGDLEFMELLEFSFTERRTL